MSAANKPFNTFDCSKKSFGFVGVNCVFNVLLMRNYLQIFKLIISAIKVFVINFQPSLNWAVKCFPNYAMNSAFCVFPIFTSIESKIVIFRWSRFNFSVRCFSRPSFAFFNGLNSSYANAQKNCNFFERSITLKHLFSVRNFCSVNCFASSNSAYISKIACFVQFFKIKNRLPYFHSLSPFNVNRSIA